ncbi:MAG: GNAT family N-acetyltransferase [Cruoricaptor ignavus]|nr:GNAT family N-acetyltransferase [Cruoricaptor ignavus]
MNLEFKIEKFSKNDFQNYFELVNDIKVMEMITERPLELEEAKEDFEKLIKNNKLDENFGSYKILTIETDEFLGFAKLTIENKGNSEAEIGYMILPKHWGKGIAGKIGQYLIKKAKTQKSIKSLFAIIDPKNLASRKILTNNGFTSKEFKDFDGLPGEVLELKFIR